MRGEIIRRILLTGAAVGVLSVTNGVGRVVSGTFVRATRSHVFIRNADGVVRAMPFAALPPSERARVRARAAQISTGGTR